MKMVMQENWGGGWSFFRQRGYSKCKCPKMEGLRNLHKASVTGMEHKRKKMDPNEAREEADVKSCSAL